MINIRKVTVVIIVVTVDIRKVMVSIINDMAVIVKVIACHHC